MYNNSYGYGVYKKSQVNVGNPYQVKSILPKKAELEDLAVEEDEIESAEKKAKKIMDKAREEALLIKREAEIEAERLLEDAREKAEQLLEEVEQKAKEEGYRYGETVAQQHYQELLDEAGEYRDRSKTEYEDTIRSLEGDIMNLAVDIAKKVIGSELELSRDAIMKICGETIRSCTNRDQIILRVSGEDYDYVVENQEKIRNSVRDLGQLEIRKDQTLGKGSCMVDTGFGMLDGSAGTRIELIEQAFMEALGERNSDD